MAETETKYCSNCKRHIAAGNFVMHEVHCRRNIVLCEQCQEPVPRSELEDHIEENHAMQSCHLCQQEVEKCKIEEHQESCPKRLVHCVYCELELPFSDLSAHHDFCGTRTELCTKCQQYVMHKDQIKHEDTNCKFPEIKSRQNGSQHQDNGIYNDILQPDELYNSFAMGELSRILNADSNMLPSSSSRNPIVDSTRNRTVRNPGVARSSNSRPKRNTGPTPSVRKTKNTNSTRNQNKPVNSGGQVTNGGEWTRGMDEDQLLAMHLAHDLSTDGDMDLPQPAWQDATLSEDDVILPCEFCGEPFPVDILLQHQGVCVGAASEGRPPTPPTVANPTSITSPEVDVESLYLPNNSPQRAASSSSADPSLSHSPIRPPRLVDNISYLAAHDWLSGPVPADDEDTFQLPCEFCGHLFPEDLLIQHQAVCDANTTQTPRVQSPAIRPSISSRAKPRGSKTSNLLLASGAASTVPSRTRATRRQADPTLNLPSPSSHNDIGASSGTRLSGSRYNDTKNLMRKKNTTKNTNAEQNGSRGHYLSSVSNKGSYSRVPRPVEMHHVTGAEGSDEGESPEERPRRRRKNSAARVQQTLDDLLENPTSTTQDLLNFMDKETKSQQNQRKKEAAAWEVTDSGPAMEGFDERPNSRRRPRNREDDVMASGYSGSLYTASFAANGRTRTNKNRGASRKNLGTDTDVPSALRVTRSNPSSSPAEGAAAASRRRATGSRSQKYPQGEV